MQSTNNASQKQGKLSHVQARGIQRYNLNLGRKKQLQILRLVKNGNYTLVKKKHDNVEIVLVEFNNRHLLLSYHALDEFLFTALPMIDLRSLEIAKNIHKHDLTGLSGIIENNLFACMKDSSIFYQTYVIRHKGEWYLVYYNKNLKTFVFPDNPHTIPKEKIYQSTKQPTAPPQTTNEINYVISTEKPRNILNRFKNLAHRLFSTKKTLIE